MSQRLTKHCLQCALKLSECVDTQGRRQTHGPLQRQLNSSARQTTSPEYARHENEIKSTNAPAAKILATHIWVMGGSMSIFHNSWHNPNSHSVNSNPTTFEHLWLDPTTLMTRPNDT